jgi:hypothetical protein
MILSLRDSGLSFRYRSRAQRGDEVQTSRYVNAIDRPPRRGRVSHLEFRVSPFSISPSITIVLRACMHATTLIRPVHLTFHYETRHPGSVPPRAGLGPSDRAMLMRVSVTFDSRGQVYETSERRDIQL